MLDRGQLDVQAALFGVVRRRSEDLLVASDLSDSGIDLTVRVVVPLVGVDDVIGLKGLIDDP